MENAKKIILKSSSSVKKIRQGKTSTASCVKSSDDIFHEHYYTYQYQLDIVTAIFNRIDKKTPFPIQLQTMCEQVMTHINTKVSGYKMQDKIKKRTIPDNFVDILDVIYLLKEAQSRCYYCNSELFVLYKNKQEMSQWTLDRIDNSIAHTIDNVVISCLQCNLKKGTKGKQAFLFTKQLSVTKRDTIEIEDVKNKDDIYHEKTSSSYENDLIISDIEYSQDT